MQTFLTRKQICFYCGRTWSSRADASSREWKCPSCDATNYLDKQGRNIEPPPIENTEASSLRYAYRDHAARTALARLSTEGVFCQKCLNNQRITTQTLAEYLPAPEHPKYHEYEALLPQVRRRLENDYPILCALCSPRVEARLKSVDYAVKTDNLRRLMNRSRQFQKLNWTGSIILVRLVVALSGWLSCFSLLLQLFWDAVGADLIGTEYAAQDMRLDETIVKCCLQLGIFRQSIRSSCAGSADTLIKASLIGSVLTCWWNRKLGEKIGRPQARWLGRGNQFQLQALVLLIRITAWGILINPGNFSLSMMMRNTVHLFMLVFITLSSIASYFMVSLDYSSRLTSQQHQEKSACVNTISQQNQTEREANPGPSVSERYSQDYLQQFPIENLALAPPTSSASLPPTPSSIQTMTTEDYSIGDDDSENAMDWTPTGYAKSFFRPQNHARAQVQERTPTNRRNPFYGTLPPAPTPPAHRIRNLGRHIPSPAPNPAMQKGMFSQPSGRVGNSFAMNLGRTAGGDRLQPNDRGHNLRDLAESKLVLGRKNDSTGLEPIFNTSFSLDDEPSELKEKQQYPSANTVDKVPTSWRSLATRGIVFPFAFGAVAAGVKHAAHS